MTNIEFTNKQFLSLLKLAYLGNWVINAHRTDDKVEHYDELEQFLFSKAKDFGLGHLVITDSHGSFPTAKFEADDEIRTYLADYDDNTFWEALIEVLAVREFNKFHNDDANLDQMQRFNILCELEDKYRSLLQKEGLENFKFVKQ